MVNKSAIPPLFWSSEVLSSASDKANCSFRNSDLDYSGISIPAFPPGNKLELHISLTPKLIKEVITNLNWSKSDPYFISVVVPSNFGTEL